MIEFPNAKINLGLNIVSKRKDGYHNLESIFVPIDWCDVLEILPAEADIFYLNQKEQDVSDRSNLVIQALDLLRKDFELPPLAVYLEKIIPIGAGLGGGSADASFMLNLLNRFAELNLTPLQLKEYAAKLGSDCPFFIENKNSLVEGRGEKITILDKKNLKGLTILLINPQIHISTKEAYKGITPLKSECSLVELVTKPISEWKQMGLKNDFEDSILPKYPAIQNIKNYLYQIGASYACMSGSGSTVFGIFESDLPAFVSQPNWLTYTGKTI